MESSSYTPPPPGRRSGSRNDRDPLFLGRYQLPKGMYKGKTREAIWNAGAIISLVINGVLIAVVILLWIQLSNIKAVEKIATEKVYEALSEAYVNFMLMEDATIVTEVRVEDTIPVQFDLQVQTNTTVTLTEATTIKNATVSLNTGGLNIVKAPTDIVLPAGTRLPISLDIVVPVDQTVPVNLKVPVNIALKDTDLREPFIGLQRLLWPYLPVDTRDYLCFISRGFDCP